MILIITYFDEIKSLQNQNIHVYTENGKSVSKLTLLTLSCPDIFTTSGPQNGRCQQLPSLHSTLPVFMCLEAFRIHAFNFFFIHMFKTLFVIRFDLVVATLVLNQLSIFHVFHCRSEKKGSIHITNVTNACKIEKSLIINVRSILY